MPNANLKNVENVVLVLHAAGAGSGSGSDAGSGTGDRHAVELASSSPHQTAHTSSSIAFKNAENAEVKLITTPLMPKTMPKRSR